MTEKIYKLLELLSEGDITIDEANELVDDGYFQWEWNETECCPSFIIQKQKQAARMAKDVWPASASVPLIEVSIIPTTHGNHCHGFDGP
jgi:hypothetical protein